MCTKIQAKSYCMLEIAKIQTCSRSYRACVGGSNLVLVSHKAFQSKSSSMFYQFLIRSYFFPLSSGEKFQTSNNTENQFWKANMGVGPTHAGNQVGELKPEKGPVSASCKRTPSVCDKALTKKSQVTYLCTLKRLSGERPCIL